MKKVFIFTISLLFFGISTATAEIAATIKPLASIVKSIAGNANNVEYLIPENVSPHNYNITPNKIRIANSSKILFAMGRQFEQSLTKAFDLFKHTAIYYIEDFNNIEFFPVSHKGINLDSHHHHSHGSLDLHIWLDPDRAYAIAQQVAEVLSKHFPENKTFYITNLKKFEAKKDSLNQKINMSLYNIKGKKFLTFHDGYAYFAKKYNLNYMGSIIHNPDKSLGANELRKLKEFIKKENIECIYTEPHFSSRLVEYLQENSNIKSTGIDPIGIKYRGENTEDTYFKIINDIAENMLACYK